MARRKQPSGAPSGSGYDLGVVRAEQGGTNLFGGENGESNTLSAVVRRLKSRER